MNEKKKQWHPGFVSATDMEFKEQRENLLYQSEYNLGTKPLQIDLLVTKKDPDIEMESEIGKIFRKYNIMEYKSPGDHLDIDAFYKVEGYGCLYKSFGEFSDARAADDITITIVRDTKPEGLFRYFREHNIRTESPFPGVYYILGNFFFRTQIIVGRELIQKDHMWIKALSNNVQKEEMKMLLEKANSLTGKHERELAESILEICLRANSQVANELRGENEMYDTLMKIMEPEVTKRINEEVNKKVKKEKKIWLQRLVAERKMSPKELSRIFDIPIKDVQELAGIQPASGKGRRSKLETQKRAKLHIRDERIR